MSGHHDAAADRPPAARPRPADSDPPSGGAPTDSGSEWVPITGRRPAGRFGEAVDGRGGKAR